MTSTRWSPLLLALGLAAAGLAACDKDGDPSGDDSNPPSGECNTANEDCAGHACGGEGVNMLPGADCLACHTPGNMPEDDEPELWFEVGGTVFTDRDGGAPVQGATVRVTDAEGQTVTLTSSAAGNFYSRQALTPPLSAEVEIDGAVRAMATEVPDGACNACHRCDGEAGGKLYID